jgi:hypothetical protein
MDDRKQASPRLAEVLDAVRWDYDPAARLSSPLASTASYFQSFPWDGEEEEEPPRDRDISGEGTSVP